MKDDIELSRHVKVGRRAPSEKDIDALHKEGIRTVLDVRTDLDAPGSALAPAEEERLLAVRGIAYWRRPVPMSAIAETDLEEVGAMLREAEKPVLIHCVAGKRAGMMALAHTSIEAGIPGVEMLDMARHLDLVFGSPEQQHMFASYVDRGEVRPGGHERRAQAEHSAERVRPLLPEDVATLRDEVQESHHRKHQLDRQVELRDPPAPAQPLSKDRKTRPLSQPSEVTPKMPRGESTVPVTRGTVRRYPSSVVATIGPAVAPPFAAAAEIGSQIGTPLGLAAAGAFVGAVLLVIDRRLLLPLLAVAGAMAGRAVVLRARASTVPAEVVAVERAQDREVHELERRVKRLAARA